MRAQVYSHSRPIRQKSIKELQEQLKTLKQKQRAYLKLTKKVKELQQRSKSIKKAGQEVSSETLQNQQIQRLRVEIQKTIAETKKIEEDNKLIRSQSKNLQIEIKALSEVQYTLSNDNKTKRQRIQLLDQQLSQKEAELDRLCQKKNCNQLVIQELRAEISRLQGEQEELRRDLQKIKMQRQEEENEKEVLKNSVDLLKGEIQEQENNYKNYKLKLIQVKQGNRIIKEELLTLIHLEEKLKAELEKTAGNYQNMIALEGQSSNKLKLMQQQLKVAQQDLQFLTDEYIKEAQVLRQSEQFNQKLNTQIDLTAKQIFQVWESVKELIQLNEGQDGEMKMKAYRVWFQITQLLDTK